MILREATDNDIETNLLNIFIYGYKLHYENRQDKFKKRTIEEQKKILRDTLNSSTILVIEIENNIIGYASYQIKDKVCKSLWIDEIVIDEKYQGKGYGKSLIKEIERKSKKELCDSIELCCWNFNESANKFYEHLDFKIQRIIFEKKN